MNRSEGKRSARLIDFFYTYEENSLILKLKIHEKFAFIHLRFFYTYEKNSLILKLKISEKFAFIYLYTERFLVIVLM